VHRPGAGVGAAPATEVKASVVLRERNRRVLEWLLGPGGPLRGSAPLPAHVHLTEKSYALVRAFVGFLVAPSDQPDARGLTPAEPRMHVILHREGPATFCGEPWQALLALFNDVVRARSSRRAQALAERLHQQLGALAVAHRGTPAGEVLAFVNADRPRTPRAFAERLARLRATTQLDPLLPALAAAVAYWADSGVRVAIVHDHHVSLTAERIRDLLQASGSGSPHPRLASVTLVDSRTDPRVQVADFLAGAARRIASEELNGRGDDGLAALLRPYVDPASAWGDARSWARLAPPPDRAGEPPRPGPSSFER
jgi:hypothetical protein